MESKVTVGTRIGSMLLDHIFMTIIAVLFFFPQMMFDSMNFSTTDSDTGLFSVSDLGLFSGISYISLIGLVLYLCKDCFNGRSLAKRALKLQVVDIKSGRVASPIKCLIRNLFIIVWPIEIIAILINPNRRIGDLVAGTRVIPFYYESEQPKIKYPQVGVTLILAYVLLLLITIPIKNMGFNTDGNNIEIIEESYNDVETMKLVEALNEQLKEKVFIGARIYDEIESNQGLKYISVILDLKENYFEDETELEKLKTEAISKLLSLYPPRTFVGKIRFEYSSQRGTTSVTIPLDWRVESSFEDNSER